jgi:hypothetical protein
VWEVVLRSTGEVLATGFTSAADADRWHDKWLDENWDGNDDNYPSCDFRKVA